MPGCNPLVAPDGTLLVTGTANTATWRLPLPLVPSLLGTEFWCQAAVPDPTANAAGSTFSNGGHVRIGN